MPTLKDSVTASEFVEIYSAALSDERMDEGARARFYRAGERAFGRGLRLAVPKFYLATGEAVAEFRRNAEASRDSFYRKAEHKNQKAVDAYRARIQKQSNAGFIGLQVSRWSGFASAQLELFESSKPVGGWSNYQRLAADRLAAVPNPPHYDVKARPGAYRDAVVDVAARDPNVHPDVWVDPVYRIDVGRLVGYNLVRQQLDGDRARRARTARAIAEEMKAFRIDRSAAEASLVPVTGRVRDLASGSDNATRLIVAAESARAVGVGELGCLLPDNVQSALGAGAKLLASGESGGARGVGPHYLQAVCQLVAGGNSEVTAALVKLGSCKYLEGVTPWTRRHVELYNAMAAFARKNAKSHGALSAYVKAEGKRQADEAIRRWNVEADSLREFSQVKFPYGRYKGKTLAEVAASESRDKAGKKVDSESYFAWFTASARDWKEFVDKIDAKTFLSAPVPMGPREQQWLGELFYKGMNGDKAAFDEYVEISSGRKHPFRAEAQVPATPNPFMPEWAQGQAPKNTWFDFRAQVRRRQVGWEKRADDPLYEGVHPEDYVGRDFNSFKPEVRERVYRHYARMVDNPFYRGLEQVSPTHTETSVVSRYLGRAKRFSYSVASDLTGSLSYNEVPAFSQESVLRSNYDQDQASLLGERDFFDRPKTKLKKGGIEAMPLAYVRRDFSGQATQVRHYAPKQEFLTESERAAAVGQPGHQGASRQDLVEAMLQRKILKAAKPDEKANVEVYQLLIDFQVKAQDVLGRAGRMVDGQGWESARDDLRELIERLRYKGETVPGLKNHPYYREVLRSLQEARNTLSAHPTAPWGDKGTFGDSRADEVNLEHAYRALAKNRGVTVAFARDNLKGLIRQAVRDQGRLRGGTGQLRNPEFKSVRRSKKKKG